MKKFYKVNNRSFSANGVDNYKALWEKVSESHDGLSFDCFTKITKKEDNKFHFTFSTATEDRHRDIVDQKFKLTNFKKNPVLLDSHSYDSITDIVGKVSKIGIKDGKLKGSVEFALDNPKGMLAYKLAEGGFLNATSIGFIPLKFEDDYKRIAESELLEISVVAVPANPEALMSKLKEFTEATEEEIKEVVKARAEEIPEEEDEITEEEIVAEIRQNALDEALEIETAIEEIKKQEVLLKISKEFSKITPKNLKEKKRKIYKNLRQLLKSV
jgi:HK97 family phage prohead protease